MIDKTADLSELSVAQIKDAILCKLVSIVLDVATNGGDKDDLARLVSEWATQENWT